MVKNGSGELIFPLSGAVLDQEHTFLFSLALLPPSKIEEASSQIVTTSLEGEGLRKTITTSWLGVNGGREAAKRRVCSLIDKMWTLQC